MEYIVNIRFESSLVFFFQMTLIGDFNWDGLVSVNRLMAQILVGTYFALTGVVCLNLYIALLSDTFSRVYAQAQANAVMQQAQLVLLVEKSLPKKKKIKFGHYMKDECGPLVSCFCLNILERIKYLLVNESLVTVVLDA